MEKIVPEFLLDKLNSEYSKEEVLKIIEGLNRPKKTTFRINTIKSEKKRVLDVLIKNKIDFEEVDWNDNAIILNSVDENSIRQLDIYNNGEIYLQSLSSMIPVMVLNPREKENILDMCAAPRTEKLHKLQQCVIIKFILQLVKKIK